MSAGIPLNDLIYWIDANDRQIGLFEELWPIPNGIAYNSYLILNRIAGVFGSYGWRRGAMKKLSGFVKRMKRELVEPVVEVKGAATDTDMQACRLLGSQIAQQLRS